MGLASFSCFPYTQKQSFQSRSLVVFMNWVAFTYICSLVDPLTGPFPYCPLSLQCLLTRQGPFITQNPSLCSAPHLQMPFPILFNFAFSSLSLSPQTKLSCLHGQLYICHYCIIYMVKKSEIYQTRISLFIWVLVNFFKREKQEGALQNNCSAWLTAEYWFWFYQSKIDMCVLSEVFDNKSD